MLPGDFSNETYWKEIYPQPLPYWQASLSEISRRHFGQTLAWERAALGRNIVFLSETWVLKLSSPGWVEDIPRETTALGWVFGKLPVRTPEWLANGWLDSWGYTIQRRMPGRNLHELWKHLSPEERKRLAFQHGELLAALRGLGLPGPADRKNLWFDWDAMIAEQLSACANDMYRASVHPALADQVDAYLAARAAVLRDFTNHVLLHGDLDHLNFLVEPDGSFWKISGLIDWGDAKIGPPAHEFISPGVHMYLGDRPAWSHFYQGCGQAASSNPDELMARAMLYYGGEFAAFLKRLSEVEPCGTWECIARQLW
jgi:hygromycin-B 7''-O-kinase